MYLKSTIIAFTILNILSCSKPTDYSGIYILKEGNCSNKYIELKRVAGFGKKYYLIYPYNTPGSAAKHKEFLGVVKGNTITINGATISIYSGMIEVRAGNKFCKYKK